MVPAISDPSALSFPSKVAPAAAIANATVRWTSIVSVSRAISLFASTSTKVPFNGEPGACSTRSRTCCDPIAASHSPASDGGGGCCANAHNTKTHIHCLELISSFSVRVLRKARRVLWRHARQDEEEHRETHDVRRGVLRNAVAEIQRIALRASQQQRGPGRFVADGPRGPARA